MPIPTCTKCRREIPAEDIHVGNDVAFCRNCNFSQKLSSLTHGELMDGALDLSRPPAGAWHRSDMVGTLIGATHRSVGTALGTLLAALFWNGIVSVFVAIGVASTLRHLAVPVPRWFPAPGMNGGPMTLGMTLFLWLFLTPFIAVGLFLLGALISTVAGKTEVRLSPKEGVVFSGVGRFGWRQRFEPEAIRNLRIEAKAWRGSEGEDRRKVQIVLETRAGKEIKFGTMWTEPRRSFVAGALRQALKLQ